jgi:hypothetical protein
MKKQLRKSEIRNLSHLKLELMTQKESQNKSSKKRKRPKNLPPELIVELYDIDLVAFKFLGFYNENMKNIIKNRPRTCFDNERKLWVVTLKEYREILGDLMELVREEGAEVQDIPEFVGRLMRIDRPFQE